MTVGQPLDVHHHEVTSFPRWLVVDECFQFVCPRRMEGDLTNAAILIDRWSFFDEDTRVSEADKKEQSEAAAQVQTVT